MKMVLKPKLNVKIQEQLAGSDQTTFRLCARLGLSSSHSQFSEAINHTNIFPRDPRLFLILDELGIQPSKYTDDSSFEALADRYEVTFKRKYKNRETALVTEENLAEILETLQNLPSTFHRDLRRFSAEVERMFSLFEKNDVFVYSSLNLLPWEWTPDGATASAKHIANAVGKGAHFIYFVPKPALLSDYVERGCLVETCQFQDIFTRLFLPQVVKNGQTGSFIERFGNPLTKEVIDKHILLIELDHNPFFAMYSKFALYKIRRANPPANEIFGFGLLPFGRPDNAFILSLNSEFTKKFTSFASWTLQRKAEDDPTIYGGAAEALQAL